MSDLLVFCVKEREELLKRAMKLRLEFQFDFRNSLLRYFENTLSKLFSKEHLSQNSL